MCLLLYLFMRKLHTVGMRLLARETWQPVTRSEVASASQDVLVPNDFRYCAQQISSTLTVICVPVWHNEGLK